ncbi:MAG: Si-specific NAD(P)(+) transhydrogenase [Myxococcota bacterium]
MRYDLVVIGGGPAGEKAAAAAAYFGRRVALVEVSPEGPGGAMVHTGTLPSKTLREAALYLMGFRRRELYKSIAQSFDREQGSLQTLMSRMSHVDERQTAQITENIERHGIDLFAGRGVIKDAQTVLVGEHALETDFILLSTGSSPRQPDCFDFSDPDVYDSDTFLRIDQLPESLAVIGGGVIGSEYACVFDTLGVKIQIIESRPRLLSFLDEEISDHLMDAMRASGIELLLDNGVERLERYDGQLRLTLKDGRQMTVDKALVSAGRTGNTAGLGLQEVGVALDSRGQIIVDAQFRTSVSNIFAAGDVIGRPALASSSMEQGRAAVAAMFGEHTACPDWDTLASGIYTIPEAASAGPTEQTLREEGVPYVVGRSHMRHNARGQVIGDVDGFIKLLFHRDDHRLLGVHVICEQATELVHIGQAVMRLGGGISYFLETLFTYPSLSMAYKYAAYDALGALEQPATRPVPLS